VIMVKPVKFDESGDSEDLQALFDSIASGGAVPEPMPTVVADSSGDSDELQALFDSVSAQVAGAPAESVQAGQAEPVVDEEVFNRLGQMARQLHESLRQLGYDKLLEDSARQIPDARQRLAYVAQMTEKAASRVLNATDIAKPIQNELLTRSQEMSARWERMFSGQLSVDEFKGLAADTRAFFQQAPERISATNAQLTEIMMAQDFQDLTGQVIRKVVEIVEGFETQLLQLLIESMPADRRAEVSPGLMNGPLIGGEGRQDVVTSQSQVDELLESLGF
jgi:chemotaxis protein CheZ